MHHGENHACHDGLEHKHLPISKNDLGIIIDPKLSFDNPIDGLVEKASRISGLLSRTM